ncbi:MAG: GNAT family N-acetyltransferase [Acidobacteria bacterium]|nr:GNAT family N-acetyltransferase [Acidobacteriota bacterium]
MGSPIIRDMAAADVESILEFNSDAVPAVSSLDNAGLEALVVQARCVLVAEDDFGPCGFLIGLGPGCRYASENYAWFSQRYEEFNYVDRIVVAQRSRSEGIGENLYDVFAADARSRGVGVMLAEVNTRPRNEGSLRFHARYGFVEVGAQDTEGGTKSVAMLEWQVGRAAVDA